MTRREALKNTALAAGYALTLPSLAAILESCQTQKRPEWQPAFFDQAQGNLMTELVEMLLPHSKDLPGAWDLGVHAFVDKFVGEVYLPEDQQKFTAGLADIEQQCQSAYGKPFMECSKEDQYALISRIDKEQRAKAIEEPDPTVFWPYFLEIKEVTYMAYFTHEQIGTEVLGYDPIPGVYQGCVPLAEVGGRAWAL